MAGTSRILRVPSAGSPSGGSVQPKSVSHDSALAAEIKRLMIVGDDEAARERFGDLVASQQRRALRVAYQYLRDVHDADEAVQDAFVKVFRHIATYREELPFEVWFTRILVNGCLDLRKARARRLRWVLPLESALGTRAEALDRSRSAEERLLGRGHVRKIAAAVGQLPARQRAVFVLRYFGELTANQVSTTLDLSEATVRVHLFRAVRKLRRLLEPEEHDWKP